MRPGRRRRWPLWVAVGIGGFLVLTVLSILIFYPLIGEWAIENKVVPKLERRLGRDVTVGSIDVSRGKAVLHDVVVRGDRDRPEHPLAEIERIAITFDFWPSLRGRMVIHDVVIEGARGHAWRSADGTDNFSDVIDRIRGRRSAKKERKRGMRFDTVELRKASVVVRDESNDVRLTIGRVDGFADRGAGSAELTATKLEVATDFGPRASLAQARISSRLSDLVGKARVELGAGAVSLWRGMSLTGITGTVTKAELPGRLLVNVSGGYGGVAGRLWDASGWVEPLARTASLDVRAARFRLERLSAILERSMVVDYKNTTVDAELAVDVSRGRAEINGKFDLTDLSFYHPKVAEKTVRDIALRGSIDASFDRVGRALTLRTASLRSRGLDFQLDGYFHLPGGIDADTGARRTHHRIGLHLVVPRTDCQAVLDAIPAELVPHLQGFQLRGKFYTDLRTDIDWANLDATKLGGSVGIRGCRVKKAPPAVDAKRLEKPFTHYAEVSEGKWIEFEVGPDNPDFVPIEETSPYLIKSLMTTEDSRFYRHDGFIRHEFKSAFIRNLKAGRFRYGASSITMQLVKNVLLYRSKLLTRKFQELFLTWYLERKLTKDRIMELYVNVIEYGPGIYGIGPAARHYFNKHPKDLNPVESAFFSSILPNPKRRHRQYCANKLWSWSARKIRRYLAIMHKRDRLTDEEYLAAQSTPLVFARDEKVTDRECRAAARAALKEGTLDKKPVISTDD